MRRGLVAAVVGVLLAFGSVVLPADTASATNYDGYSIIYCSAHPPPFGGELLHSWPYSLEPGILYYVCTWGFFGVVHQGFVGRNMNTGHHWLQGSWQECQPSGYIDCEPHGKGT